MNIIGMRETRTDTLNGMLMTKINTEIEIAHTETDKETERTTSMETDTETDTETETETETETKKHLTSERNQISMTLTGLLMKVLVMTPINLVIVSIQSITLLPVLVMLRRCSFPMANLFIQKNAAVKTCWQGINHGL
jgi:Tfp pilus assembly major pilin PilA